MKILLIDDHVMFSESIKLLFIVDHQITTVSNGSDALLQLTSTRPDVILLDQSLPDLDGITLLKLVRALPDPPPVLMLSGDDDPELITTAKLSGASGYLHKSSEPKDLIAAVMNLYSGELVWPNTSLQAPTQEPSTLATPSVCKHITRELGITDRQIDVLTLMASGLPNKTIAKRLGIAESTVKTHLKSLFLTLKVGNRVACQNRARELGLFADK